MFKARFPGTMNLPYYHRHGLYQLLEGARQTRQSHPKAFLWVIYSKCVNVIVNRKSPTNNVKLCYGTRRRLAVQVVSRAHSMHSHTWFLTPEKTPPCVSCTDCEYESCNIYHSMAMDIIISPQRAAEIAARRKTIVYIIFFIVSYDLSL